MKIKARYVDGNEDIINLEGLLNIEFVLDNGQTFKIEGNEDCGKLGVYCFSRIIIHPKAGNMVLLEERGI